MKLKSFATSEEAKAKESDKFVIGPRLQGISLDTDKCVIWPGAVREGYGVKKIGNTTINAHRYVYEKATGKKIPKGYAIDHKCRNRLCVNPKHLEVVTHSENMTRSWAARVKKKDSAKTLQRDAAVATGTGILLAPRKYAVPYSDVHSKISGSTARTEDLASISGGSGRRFYDQRHVDNIAAKMKESGFDPSKPIQIEQAKDGTKKIADGNHRLRAAQQAGIKDIPMRIVNNNKRTTTTTSNLLTHSLKLRRLEKARRPILQQENAYKAIPSWAKKLNSLKSSSEFKNGKYIGGATAATALGTYGYARRKEIKDLIGKTGA